VVEVMGWHFSSASYFSRIQQEMWPDLHISSDPRRLWSYLEWIGAVTLPPLPLIGNERERKLFAKVI